MKKTSYIRKKVTPRSTTSHYTTSGISNVTTSLHTPYSNLETPTIEYKTVSELNQSIKQTLEKPFNSVKVCGELSNFKISNNNLFATLKDNDSTINLVLWRYGTRKRSIIIGDGDTVNVYGKLSLFLKSGSYCITVDKFEKIGMGDLHREYELLKQKYDQLGYFTNKKEFPQQLTKIGIITALEGAALQDILYVFKNNFYGKIVIRGCMVQGTHAPQSIVEGINQLVEWENEYDERIDIIIIARGGGSFEDLIAFSSPIVIEAIHNCDIFTISGVGHEIDFMLSDYVADMRAPTPSVSAEIVLSRQKKQYDEYMKCKSYMETHIDHILRTKLSSYKTKIQLLLKSVGNPEVKLLNCEIQLKDLKKRLSDSILSKIQQIRNRLDHLFVKLQKYDIQNMLEQGYVVLIKNNRIVDSINDVKTGQKLKLKMRDGEVNIIISN